MPSVITVNAIEKHMKSTLALDGVSARFESSVTHGIIGPNGAGKTTLLRLLSGLLSPDKGEITFNIDGKVVLPAVAKAQTAYFPQEPSLYPDLSCMEHMQFFSALYSMSRAEFNLRSSELFASTGMGDFKERKAGALSGGMYKKLGLMCVLLNRPKILLLDEPTIGVDPVSRRELWELVYRFAKEDMNIIMSTSYMDEAMRCGCVHVLNAGHLVTSDAPGKIMETFKLTKFEDIFLASAGGK